MKMILASTSPYRKSLLKDVGLNVDTFGANIDEYSIVGSNPIQTAQYRARAKAESVRENHSKAVVIGADQVCYIDEVVMDKPRTSEEWFLRLQSMRGRSHFLSTAVCILVAPTPTKMEECIEFVVTTQVFFRSDLSDEDLKAYIDIGEAKKCAGGYMMEKRGAWLIERIEGDWQNVIGLPIFPLLAHLKRIGCPIFGAE